MTTPLPAMDRPGRLMSIATALSAQQLDALWVTKAVNVRWLTGFTGSNGSVLVFASGSGAHSGSGPRVDAVAVLVTDGRYETQAADQLAEAGLSDLVAVDIATSAADTFAQRPFSRLAFEAHDLSVQGHGQLESWATAQELVPVTDLIETARTVKDDGEHHRLARAAAIADEAWQSVLCELVPGVTEARFARALDNAMLDLGADGISFDTIVAAGANSARPHHRPGTTVVEAGDLVVMDFGAAVDGYGSDMTRTVVVGAEPSQRQQELYDAVQEAQAAGVAAVRAEVEQVLIDSTCRSVLESHGLGEAFIHGTGHAIGLEIHEQPILSPRSVGILPAGLVVTVEPGAYIAGFGGVRIEDSVVVTPDGCYPITTSPKGLTPPHLESGAH